MGISAHSRHAIRNSLGLKAANELIPLLDVLKEKVEEDAARRAVPPAPATEPPAPAEPAPPAPPAPPAEEGEEHDAPPEESPQA